MTAARPLGVCCVVALLLVAGCAAPGSSGPPPGLSASNVTDANALVEAHTNTLKTQSFTVETTRTVTDPNGERNARINGTYRFEPSGTVEGRIVTTTQLGTDPPQPYDQIAQERDAYRRGNVTYVRSVRGDNVTYQRTGLFNSSVTLGRALQRRTINLLNDRQNATVEPVTVDGEQRYRIHAHLNDSRFRENAVVNLTVTSDGLVRELTFRRTVALRNTQRLTTHVRVSRVGETTVERPDWYETARNATASG